MTTEINVKYLSGDEYTLKHGLKGLLTVHRNGVFLGSIGFSTLAHNLEVRKW